ncbi:MAG: S41 family peptidase [Candidatus Zambryskibacteria bacterium]|nr:S41 family peptidase [Candidatus Zambryskibacteria bacterium]
MNNFAKYRTRTILLILIFGAIFLSGFYLGQNNKSESEKVVSIINKDSTGVPQVDFASFWQVWNVIDEKYVPTVSSTSTASTDPPQAERVDDQTRVYGAIEGMVKSLGDPYTIFFPPAESKSFSEEVSGNFEGVGMEVGIKENVLTVISPLKGTPAYNAGIKTGDKIIKIDSTLTAPLNTEQAIKLIRGKKGTMVKLTIVRAGIKDPFVVSVVRDVINIPSIDTETKGDVFIIRLYNFSAISPDTFRKALRQFIESDKYKLVIDLRGNPGGYLEAAIDMASWFLPAGKVVVKEDFRNAEDAQIYRSKGYNIFTDKLKLVVLIDNGSASASEILAGALHEHGLATLVGTQSFGKGSVQELVNITPTTSLKVTIARWLTPKGTSISGGGLTPDVEVKLDEKEFAKGNDNQLNRALEILNK